MLPTQYSDVNSATNTVNIDFSLIEVKDEKVNCRNLYQFLGLSLPHWSKWIVKNIIKNQFAIENEDYTVFTQEVKTSEGGRPTQNFNISIDFAKKICMMAKTDVGEKARNYFLDCEKKAQTVQIQITPEPKSIVELLKQNNIWLETLSAENTELKIVVKDTSKQLEETKAEVIKLAPKAEFVDKTFTNGQTGLSTMKTVAHECGVKIIPLYKLLRDKKVWFYQLNEHAQMENAVMAKYIQSGHFVVKQFWSDRQRCYFDKIFATAKGKLLCWNLIKEGNQSNNQLMDLELA